ncbi:hypothetical protein LTR70_003473 [Exophiala xenobiotica]|uniref:Alpha/beta hydrolase fold-3 domain-containing protein n=1 Tax=Lithohypha guttulata TaxID=1690604 RepID=A0ABR0KG60_9EURO|nr:hypothetical protein LTR24_003021 [Lithohypha guttulata]KAK5323011.1 hypothetical protein LTR70_003473 [Exophiala xenobiotica]
MHSIWSVYPPRVKILNSSRYGPYRHRLFNEVKDPIPNSKNPFRGRWIVRDSITEPISSNPPNSDIVIFYLHGGGYFSSSTSSYLLFLLRLSETILRSGKTVSIFALEYDLAPEHTFPTQLRQARAAYDWLLDELGGNRRQLLVMGDSAGAHLALSLLVDLQEPHNAVEGDPAGTAIDTTEKSDLKPGLGLVLLSPWLSLHHQPESFTRNAMTDILAPPALHRSALQFLGPRHRTPWPPRSPHLEFLAPDPAIDWNTVLPDWVWVSAGKHEILYDDIIRWIVDRGTDCHGASRIDGQVDKDEPHVYAWFKTTDVRLRKSFVDQRLELDREDKVPEYEPIDRIAEAILKRYAKVVGA